MPVPSLKTLFFLFIAILFILSLFLAAGRSLAGNALGLVALLLALGAAGYGIVKSNRAEYKQGNIPYFVAIRNIYLQIAGLLLALLVAALAGRALAQVVAGHTGSDLLKISAGIVVGLLVGLLAGALVQHGIRLLVRTFPGQ